MSNFFLFTLDRPLPLTLVLELGFDLRIIKLYLTLSIIFIFKNISRFQELKTNSFCVGNRHFSGVNNIRGILSSKDSITLTVNCTNFKIKESMTVSYAAIEVEGLKDFFKIVGKATVRVLEGR